MADFIRRFLVELGFDDKQAVDAVQRSNRSFTELNQAIELVQKGFGVAESAFNTFARQLERAGQVEGLTQGFKNFQAQAGLLASDSLPRLREATQGLISDFDLMSAANLAATLGLPLEEFDQLAQNAIKLGAAVGRDATGAIQDLSFGVGRMSRMILDNLGIVVSAEDAYKRFAAANNITTAAMDDAQKKMAFVDLALEKIAEGAETAGAVQLTAAGAADQLAASYQNVTDQFTTGLSSSERLRDALSELAGVTQDGAESSTTLGKQFGDLGATVLEELVIPIGRAVQAFVNLNTKLEELPTRLKIAGLETIRLTESWGEWLAISNPLLAQTTALTDKLRELAGVSKDEVGREIDDLTKRLKLELEIFHDTDAAAEDLTKTLASGGGSAGSLAGATDEAAEKAKKLREEWAKTVREIELRSLEQQISAAIADLDEAQFRELLLQFEDATFEGLMAGWRKFVDGGIPAAEVRERAEAEALLSAEVHADAMSEASIEAAIEQRDALKEKYQEAADFYTDVFRDAVDGTLFDLENALERFASGVAGGALASIFGGAPGTSITGLGQQIGGSVIGGGISNLLGSAGGAALGSVGLGGGLGSIASAIGLGGSATTGLLGGGFAGSITGLGSAAGPIGLGLGLGAFALNEFGVFDDLFGGGGDPDELSRREFREQLTQLLGSNLQFQTVGGPSQSLFDIDFADFGERIEGGDELLGEAATLTGGVANALTGGGKLGEDFQSIFALAVSDAEDFNEVVVNTLSLMDSLGISAEEAKGGLTQAFLDGTVSIDEFATQLYALNLLATEDLESIGAAIDIMGRAFDQPRQQIKALELGFKEAGQVGEDQFGILRAEIVERFGPEAGNVFDRLKDVGITTFEDIQSASAEQILAMAQVLDELETFMGDISKTGEQTGKTLSNAFQESADSIFGAVREADGLQQRIERLNGSSINIRVNYETSGEESIDDFA